MIGVSFHFFFQTWIVPLIRFVYFSSSSLLLVLSPVSFSFISHRSIEYIYYSPPTATTTTTKQNNAILRSYCGTNHPNSTVGTAASHGNDGRQLYRCRPPSHFHPYYRRLDNESHRPFHETIHVHNDVIFLLLVFFGFLVFFIIDHNLIGITVLPTQCGMGSCRFSNHCHFSCSVPTSLHTPHLGMVCGPDGNHRLQHYDRSHRQRRCIHGCVYARNDDMPHHHRQHDRGHYFANTAHESECSERETCQSWKTTMFTCSPSSQTKGLW